MISDHVTFSMRIMKTFWTLVWLVATARSEEATINNTQRSRAFAFMIACNFSPRREKCQRGGNSTEVFK
jgi:hypothetical protein